MKKQPRLLKQLMILTHSKDLNSLAGRLAGQAKEDPLGTVKQIARLYEQEYPRARRLLANRPPAARATPPPLTVPGVEWRNGAFQAETDADVKKLVKAALNNKRKVRVAGAGHSFPAAIYTDSAHDLRVVLRGDLQRVTFGKRDGDRVEVVVGGGCYMGVNPSDPLSTPKNSLNHILNRHGFALPALGGISHQSIAGFLQTGSAGGSLKHGIADVVDAIEIVDGAGQAHWLTGDHLNAAAVSMGLAGIVTRVRLRAVPRYYVDGAEQNLAVSNSLLREVNGRYAIEDALTREEYLHVNWFPQQQVQGVVEWRGRQSAPEGKRVPYKGATRTAAMNLAAAAVLEVTGQALASNPRSLEAGEIIGALLKLFVTPCKPRRFHDVWYHALPSDDQSDVDTLLKVNLTEIWLPLDRLGPAMDRLKALFRRNQAAAGNFITEFYGAKKSPYWLSPSYERDVFRVDVFWWAYSPAPARQHFAVYWNELLDLPGARLHWGKYLPEVGQQCGRTVFDTAFLRKAYPRFDDWWNFRAEMDPECVFVSRHWARVLQV